MRPALLVFAFVCACGSTSSNGGTGSDAGSSGGGGDANGDANGNVDAGAGDGGQDGGGTNDSGGIPAVSCADDNVTSIAGTWDLITSDINGQKTATLQIDASTFAFTSGDESLAFAVNGGTMSLSWQEGTTQTPITASRTSAVVDTGLIPLAIGGQWTFASTTNAESCTASLAAATFTSTCTQVHGTPFGDLDGTVTAQRSAQLTSIFGEFGGRWHVTGSGGSDTVDVTFTGSTFTASVNGGADWVTIKVCNGTAVGKTSGGFEIAGTRR